MLAGSSGSQWRLAVGRVSLGARYTPFREYLHAFMMYFSCCMPWMSCRMVVPICHVIGWGFCVPK